MSNFCTKCGKALTEGAKFCTGCGAAIQEEPQESAAKTYEAVQEETVLKQENRYKEAPEEIFEEEDEEEENKDFAYYVKKVLVGVLMVTVMFESKYYYKHDRLYIPPVIQETLGIGSNADIDIVKNGSLREYPGVKIGKEMDRFFDDAKWSSEDMGKGGKRVTCSGTCIWEGRQAKAAISFMVLDKKVFGQGNVTINGRKLSPQDAHDVVRTIMKREYSI